MIIENHSDADDKNCQLLAQQTNYWTNKQTTYHVDYSGCHKLFAATIFVVVSNSERIALIHSDIIIHSQF